MSLRRLGAEVDIFSKSLGCSFLAFAVAWRGDGSPSDSDSSPEGGSFPRGSLRAPTDAR